VAVNEIVAIMLVIIDLRRFYYIIKANAQAFVTSQDVDFQAFAKKNLLVINEIVAIMFVIIDLRRFYYITQHNIISINFSTILVS